MVGETQNNIWPLPKFFFSVKITGVGDNLPFQHLERIMTGPRPR